MLLMLSTSHYYFSCDQVPLLLNKIHQAPYCSNNHCQLRPLMTCTYLQSHYRSFQITITIMVIVRVHWNFTFHLCLKSFLQPGTSQASIQFQKQRQKDHVFQPLAQPIEKSNPSATVFLLLSMLNNFIAHFKAKQQNYCRCKVVYDCSGMYRHSSLRLSLLSVSLMYAFFLQIVKLLIKQFPSQIVPLCL